MSEEKSYTLSFDLTEREADFFAGMEKGHPVRTALDKVFDNYRRLELEMYSEAGANSETRHFLAGRANLLTELEQVLGRFYDGVDKSDEQ